MGRTFSVLDSEWLGPATLNLDVDGRVSDVEPCVCVTHNFGRRT